jgi:hypothetical protein
MAPGNMFCLVYLDCFKQIDAGQMYYFLHDDHIKICQLIKELIHLNGQSGQLRYITEKNTISTAILTCISFALL